MKKYILMPVLAALSLSGSVAQAQDFDNKPVVNVSNSKENLNFTIGARFMMDGAYYHSDFTPVKSGAAITDARIRTSMSYEDWYFYADFDFSKGKFSQKNIFLQYSLEGAKVLIALKPVTTIIRHPWQTIPAAEACTSFPARRQPMLSHHHVSWV